MNRHFKGIASLILAFIFMLTSIVPAYADEQGLPDISDWAMLELNEGEKYGIFPIEWYYDGFREDINEEKLKTLFKKTNAKIAAIELEKKESTTDVIGFESGSRESILDGLYSILSQYEFSAGESALSYMKDRQIINGTEKGLELERVATTEEAVLLASRFVRDTYSQVEAGSKGVAWKVENNGNTVYLLGSIHLGIPDLYPLHEKLVSAYRDSDALFVEANLFDFDGIQYYAEAMIFQDGRTIKDVVSDDSYEKVLQVFEKYELPVDEYILYKPWSLASLFSNLSTDEFSGVNQMANYGIDLYFLGDALTQNKPILELEGMKAQTNMFEGLSKDTQEEYLLETIRPILAQEQVENQMEMLGNWFTLWSNGDKVQFADSLIAIEDERSEFDQILFGERDMKMAEKITELLNSEAKGTYFVVVGAGHFLNNESILYHLEENGFEVVDFYH